MKKNIPVLKDGQINYEIMLRRDFEDLKNLPDVFDASNRKVCIVSDSNVAPIYQKELFDILSLSFKKVECFVLEAGESNKNLSSIEKIYEFLIEKNFDRKDMLVALGGGVVGDMTGFAAATYLRGIDFIQIPTSLLAISDSSVGGKTGVDFKAYKNMVGAFYMPKLVYINVSVLSTLPMRELSCGMAEVIKYGFIMDPNFLNVLDDISADIMKKDIDSLMSVAARSCECKKEVVEEDPNEKGRRAILNFGHTAGHAIEKACNFALLHGECVAIGMNVAMIISKGRGYINEAQYIRGINLLKKYSLPISLSEIKDSLPSFTYSFKEKELIELMLSDKKTLGGKIRFILLKSFGESFISEDITKDEIHDALKVII